MNQSLTPQEQQDIQPRHPQLKIAEDQGPVNLNEVVQEIIGNMKQGSGQSRAIIRFEALPVVTGSPEKLQELFVILLHSIVVQGSSTTKPFIYIRCAQQENEVMDLSIPANTGLYSLAVYTNIVANHAWLEQHQADI